MINLYIEDQTFFMLGAFLYDLKQHLPMLNEFVDKILVHAPDKSSGERVQEVKIYFKFIGKFDIL